MKTLNGKIIFFGIGICLFTGIIISSYSFMQTIKFATDSKIKEEENHLNIFAESIRSNLSELKNDALFLSSTPPIKGILRSRSNGGIDPLDGSSEELWKGRLATIFSEMLYAKKRYIQVRYIGVENNGREIVRVERKNIKVLKTKEHDLQSKENEFYFKPALSIEEGSVYLSSFTLNREKGKIVYPLQMVLRAAVPIYKTLEDPFGFVIINVDYSSILNGASFLKKEGLHYLIVDNHKNILLDSENEQGFSLGLSEKYKGPERFKNLNWIQNEKTRISIADGDTHIHILKKIFYNPQSPQDFISILLILDKSVIQEKITSDTIESLLLLIFLLILSIVFSLAFSSKIVSPINQLMDLAKRINLGGEIDFSQFQVHSKDEFGKLTETLLRLSKDIMKKNHQLDSQQEALDSFAIVAETDSQGKIIYVNSKFIELSKYSKKELIGQDHRIVNSGYHPKEFFEELWRTISSGRVWRGEIKNRAKDGSYYWVDTTIFPILDENNTLQKYVAIRYDITERKKFEDEILLASEKTKKAMEVKSTFLANMSHEIRTPLNGILGFTNLLLDQELSSESHEQVEHIKECSEGLLTIVNDILDISKMEAGKLIIENETFDLVNTVDSSVVMFDSIIKEKKISLSYSIMDDVPNYIKGDSLRLRQVLVNLIGNAIKFTSEKGKVHVKVELDEKLVEGKVKLKFSVKDNGIGISEKVQQRLFRSFEQADLSTTRKYGGSGLGLSICSKLVILMGGQIWLESKERLGTTFYFSMIADISQDEFLNKEESSFEANVHSLERLSILLVEDNLINKKIVCSFLKKLKQTNVHWVVNGKDAVDTLKEREFDLIFMDMQMPVMDGIEATRIIREDLDIKTPIVGVSANAFEEDRLNALDAGMNYYLSKPLEMKKLSHVLEQIYSKMKYSKVS